MQSTHKKMQCCAKRWRLRKRKQQEGNEGSRHSYSIECGAFVSSWLILHVGKHYTFQLYFVTPDDLGQFHIFLTPGGAPNLSREPWRNCYASQVAR